jgi:Uma2 family endonuclease
MTIIHFKILKLHTMKDEIFVLNEPQLEYGKAVQKTVEIKQDPVKKRVSLDDYLEMIADGTRRLEYHNGEVVDIQSATEQHGNICTNLTGIIYSCIRGTGCKVYAGDREVWIEECKKIYYPDVIIVCGEHKLKQMSKNVKATVNPSVVIEVLSDSTEGYDLSIKLRCYKTIKGLKQIIFVAQEEKYVRVLTPSNEKDHKWEDMEYFEDEETILIGDCATSLKDIYEDVIFENQGHRAPHA